MNKIKIKYMLTIPFCFTTTYSILEKKKRLRILDTDVLSMAWGKHYVCIIAHWFRKNSK